MNSGCYCSLVISREVFFVSEGHRKPETYCANSGCDGISSCQQPGTFMHIGTIYGNRPRNRIAVRNDAPSWKCSSNYIFVPQRFKKNRTRTSGDVYGYDR